MFFVVCYCTDYQNQINNFTKNNNIALFRIICSQIVQKTQIKKRLFYIIF